MKNAYLLLLSLCLYLLTLLLSCEIIETNDTADSYFPLKVGYYWKYARTFPENIICKECFPDTIVTSVIGSTIKNNHIYYKIEHYLINFPKDTVLVRNEGYNVFSYNPFSNREELIYNFKQDDDTLRKANYFHFSRDYFPYYYIQKSFFNGEATIIWKMWVASLWSHITTESFFKNTGRTKIDSWSDIGHCIYALSATNVTNYKKNN
jgi:hypothetical protein